MNKGDIIVGLIVANIMFGGLYLASENNKVTCSDFEGKVVISSLKQIKDNVDYGQRNLVKVVSEGSVLVSRRGNDYLKCHMIVKVSKLDISKISRVGLEATKLSNGQYYLDWYSVN